MKKNGGKYAFQVCDMYVNVCTNVAAVWNEIVLSRHRLLPYPKCPHMETVLVPNYARNRPFSSIANYDVIGVKSRH